MLELQYNFKDWVWQHLSNAFIKLDENSILFRFLQVLCVPLGSIILSKVSKLQDQISIHSAEGQALDQHGTELNLSREEFETDDNYRSKLIILDLIYSGGTSITNLKSLTFSFLGVTPSVFEAYSAQQTAYINTGSDFIALGLNPTSINATFRRLTYYIVLPDLTGKQVNRLRFIRAVLDVNYGANEPIVLEKKEQATNVILGTSTIGTLKSYLTSILQPKPILVERWH